MKIEKGLKGLFLALCVLITLGLFVSAAPYISSDAPQFQQAAFYTSSYKCFYMVGSPDETKDEMAEVNTWLNYTRELDKGDIHYDGMSGSYVGLSIFRIKACTPGAGETIAMYIDNIKMINTETGEEIFLWDFEDGEAHGPFFAQGGNKAKNMTVVDIDGNKAFLMHGTTINQYGNNGVEMSWNLPPCPDSKSGSWNVKNYGRKKFKYTISYDYYFAVAE